MTPLDQVIAAAFASEGKQEDVNKVYLTFLQSTLFVPVKKMSANQKHVDEQEPFSPLFAVVEENYFMVVFDTLDRLTAWSGEHQNEIDHVEISGKDVISGINESVYLCLNLGTEFYKEFSPDEVKRLKMVVAKIDQIKNGA